MNKLKNMTIVSAIAFTMITAITLHSMSLSFGRKSYKKTLDDCTRDAETRTNKIYNLYWGPTKSCPDKATENPMNTKHQKLVKNSGACHKDNIIYLTSSFTNGVMER